MFATKQKRKVSENKSRKNQFKSKMGLFVCLFTKEVVIERASMHELVDDDTVVLVETFAEKTDHVWVISRV